MRQSMSNLRVNDDDTTDHEVIAEAYVNMISTAGIPKAITRDAFTKETLEDEELQEVKISF